MNAIRIEVVTVKYTTLRAYLMLDGKKYSLESIDLLESYSSKFQPFVSKWRKHAHALGLPFIVPDATARKLTEYGVS